MSQTSLILTRETGDQWISTTFTGNRGFFSITTIGWTEQMFYELPSIVVELYIEGDSNRVKTSLFSQVIKLYDERFITGKAFPHTINVENVPENCFIKIIPCFDDNAIPARNALIENGIEEGTIWNHKTDSFNVIVETNTGGEPKEQVISGVPPLSFISTTDILINCAIKGNAVQDGTPTPDAPIMPDFVGVKTGNLFDDDNAEFGKWVNSNGSIATNATYAAGYNIKVRTADEFVIKYYGDKPYSYSMAFYDSNGDFLSRIHRSNPSASYDIFPVPENAVSARFQVACPTSIVMTSAILKAMKLMLNLGSTVLPYEPYGYEISITSAGQTVPVYLGQVQTVRQIKKLVLTGSEEWTIPLVNDYGIANFLCSTVVSDRLGRTGNVLCSHFIYNTDTNANVTTENIRITNANNLTIRRFSTEFPTVDSIKSWLSTQYQNGTPVCVWYVLAEATTGIINEPLCKIGDYADELDSTTAGITIPTTKGINTVDINTTLPPSEVTIVFK